MLIPRDSQVSSNFRILYLLLEGFLLERSLTRRWKLHFTLSSDASRQTVLEGDGTSPTFLTELCEIKKKNQFISRYRGLLLGMELRGTYHCKVTGLMPKLFLFWGKKKIIRITIRLKGWCRSCFWFEEKKKFLRTRSYFWKFWRSKPGEKIEKNF